MCGRYTLTVDSGQLLERFGVSQFTFDYQPRYNLAPGQMIPAVIHTGGTNRLGLLKWGLVPAWAKDPSIGSRMINAQSETVQIKPSFRNLFLRKRCIIPADGFYEWMSRPEGKQPMRIVNKSGEVFSFAGLYDTWVQEDGSKLHTVTILTTKPNELMQPIHSRMPVILNRKDEAIWLDRDKHDAEMLQALLQPYPSEELHAYPVSKLVGNVRNDSEQCITPL